MRKTVPKASYFDASYPRRSLYGRDPTSSPLTATMERMGTVPKKHLVDRNQMGMSTAYDGHSKPPTDLNTQGITPTLPTFDGQHNRDLILWLIEIKCYFLKQYTPESMKCELVVSCLKGYALFWYNTLNFSRRMEGKGRIKSWHRLESHMRKRFALSCAMSELETNGETLKQQPLNTNKITNPCTKPLPNMESTFENVQTIPKPDSKTKEQTSLKTICPQDEMTQPVCKKNLTREKIKCFLCQEVGHLRKNCPSTKATLGIPCSLGLATGVDKIIGNIIEIEDSLVDGSLVYAETAMSENDVDQGFKEPSLDDTMGGSVYDPPKKPTYPVESPCEEMRMEKEHGHSNMIPFGATQIVDTPILSTYISPLDLYINERLQQPMSLNMSHFFSLLDGQECGSPINKGPTECTQFICPKFQTSIAHIKHYPEFNHGCLRSLKCVLSMPHFHFYMLKRMQVSLVHLNAISCTFEKKIGSEDYNNYQPPWSNSVKYFEEFGDWNYVSWGQSMLLSELCIPGTPHQGHNNIFIFDPGISGDTWMDGPSKIGIMSTPEPNHQRPCYGLGSGESRRVEEEHKGPCEPLSFLDFLIKGWAWLLDAYLTWKVAWPFMEIISLLSELNMLSSGHGTVIYDPPRQFLLVFDPGGVNPSYYLGMQKVFTPLHILNMSGYVVKEMFSFIHQNLRTNSFEPGEVETGASPKGLSKIVH